MHVLQQRGGPLAKFLQGSLETHNPGGVSLEIVLAQRPDPVSAYPGHQYDQPPLSRTPHIRGGDPCKYFQPPLDTHNPGGEPLAKVSSPHEPARAQPGHPSHTDHPTQQAPPPWHTMHQRGVPWRKFRYTPRLRQERHCWGEEFMLPCRRRGLGRTRGVSHPLSGSTNPQLPLHSGNQMPHPPPNHHRRPQGGRGPNGPSYARPVRRHYAGVCCGPVRCGHGWRGVGPSFPLPSHSWGKGCSPLPPTPTLCVWCGGRQ